MLTKDVANQLDNNPDLLEKMKADPAATLRAMATPLSTDPWIYRGVVIILGIIVIGALIGSLILCWLGKTVPEGVISLGSTALGALAGLLVLPRP